MTQSGPKQRQHHQVFLAILLFLIGQLALALHSHDHGPQSIETEECVVCLVSSSDDSGAVSESPQPDISIHNNQLLPAFCLLEAKSCLTSAQPRAPPIS